MGQGRQRPAVDLDSADRHGRAGRRGLSTVGPLVVFERLRLLPMGCPGRRRAASGAEAPPDARVFLVPRADYRIEDNWHVTGLCGTGSKDIFVDEALVPEHRTHSFVDAFHLRHPGTAVNDAPLYRLPFAIVFRYGITSPVIGAAIGALDAFREQSRRRINLNTRASVAEDPFIQHRLAEVRRRSRRRA